MNIWKSTLTVKVPRNFQRNIFQTFLELLEEFQEKFLVEYMKLYPEELMKESLYEFVQKSLKDYQLESPNKIMEELLENFMETLHEEIYRKSPERIFEKNRWRNS